MKIMIDTYLYEETLLLFLFIHLFVWISFMDQSVKTNFTVSVYILIWI